jgi:cytochrome c553
MFAAIKKGIRRRRTWRDVRAAFRASSAVALLAATSGLPLETQAQVSDAQTLEMRVLSASPYSIHADEALHAFVQERAQAAIATHCARCHGEDLEGRPGVPNLVDYDWLWGITFQETNDVAPVMEIEQTILYGVRNTDCPDIEDVSYYGA